MRALLVRAIVAAGHEVVAQAIDADAAVSAATIAKPDAIVLDGRLPGEAASALVARLRRTAPDVALFVIVSFAERDVLDAAIAAGASGGIVRPLRPDDVRATLARLEATARASDV